ncbi:MAG: hypothetical protein AB1792_11890 [Candidatus Zixiibacteriota bacterium]
MTPDLSLLLGTAATIGFVHTVLGPDHYLPFVAMAKARNWSMARMSVILLACGVGHVGSSVVIGILGIALGWALGGMEAFEAARGAWAAWGLIGFGLAYGTWGVWRALRGRAHMHLHVHGDGTVHDHTHGHADAHAHAHTTAGKVNITPWILFTIFVFGPCEPLIPLLMVPAAQHSWWGLALVTLVFGAVTITTMAALSLALTFGLNVLPLGRLERWSHALAGFALFACGAAIQWLGL